MNQLAYKVVLRSTHDELVSVHVADNAAKIVYIPNQWVVPIIKNSKIFVFSAFEHAYEFAIFGVNSGFELWSCNVADVSVPPTKVNNLYCLDSSSLEFFWSKNQDIYGIFPPKGTLVCSAVKLLERLE